MMGADMAKRELTRAQRATVRAFIRLAERVYGDEYGGIMDWADSDARTDLSMVCDDLLESEFIRRMVDHELDPH